jgi:hypothetical protein
MLRRFFAFSVLATSLAISAGVSARPKSKPPTAPAGAASQARAVEVLWGGSWWAAETLESKNGQTKIHYSGWGSEWDEWVDASRLRSAFHPALKNPKAGQKIEVEWHGSWWAAEIVEARSGFFKIHYAGWGSEWEEWIEQNRMRALAGSR